MGCADICDLCTGPLDTDCVRCKPGAYRNVAGVCECSGMWTGTTCATFNIECDHRCIGCNGPENFNCTECADHAKRNSSGACVCDGLWTGFGCGFWAGQCAKNCARCTGPLTTDCVECIGNTVSETDCSCQTGWGGDLCMDYVGICFSTCRTCFGPTAGDCYSCVANAFRDTDGDCICDTINYASALAEDCSIYGGVCHWICASCNGPSAFDCVACIEHAHRNSHGKCQCDLDWTGNTCQDYVGVCSQYCNGCFGPNPDQCTECVTRAIVDDASGACVCEANWGGLNCRYWYGECHSTCSGCYSDSPFDCYMCIDNAYRNAKGECVCEEGWDNPDSDICDVYSGKCSLKCKDNNCTKGPMICHECVENAHRDLMTGYCVCNDLFHGNACQDWRGQCDDRCDHCTGPYNTDCLQCVDNSTIFDGACVCEEFWGGDACDIWGGECHPICNGCYGGTTDANCILCVENAYRSMGRCVCRSGWGGDRCTDWVDFCSIKCDQTQDPICDGWQARDCTKCIANAHRDLNGDCVCDSYWLGDLCTSYSGRCHSSGTTCVGPAPEHVLTCRGHATLSETGCVCDEFWSGSGCEHYIGACDPKCRSCIGAGSLNCLRCESNAYRNVTGECVCLPGWQGDDCRTPGIECHSSCLSCTGSGANECSACFNGDVLIDTTCMSCDGTCKTCTGTASNQCATCRTGTFLNDDNECQTCHMSCLDCSGPADNQCTYCSPDSFLASGVCRCSDGYGRHPTSHRCVTRCPTFFTLDHVTRSCVADPSRTGELDFSGSTHPPMNIPDRGLYFDGNASLQITDFEIFYEFTFDFWIRFFDFDVTILSLRELPTWTGYTELSGGSNSERFGLTVEQGFFLELKLNGGHFFEYNMSGFRSNNSDMGSSYDGEWVLLAVTATRESSTSYNTVYKVYIYGNAVLTITVTGAQIFDNYNTASYIGATYGKAYYMNAILYSHTYWTTAIIDFSAYFGDCSTNQFNPVGACLDRCGVDQYVDSDNQCVDCDSNTCQDRCVLGGTCSQTCDPSCRDCNGRSANGCLSCWSNARLADYGSCVCENDTTANPISCPDACTVNHCDICEPLDKCIHCSEGYHLTEEGLCIACSYLNDCIQGIAGVALIIGADNCTYGQRFDTACRDCPNDCGICTKEECISCNPGAVYIAETNICSCFCATGFEKNAFANSCRGSDTLIFDFSFNRDLRAEGEWRYTGTYTSGEINVGWEVAAWGGDNAQDGERADPFMTDERGLWMDGKLDYVTLKGFILHHTSTMMSWAKPQGYGSLFSSTARDADGSFGDFGLTFGIQDSMVEFEDMTINIKAVSTGTLQFYIWQHISVTVSYDSSLDQSTVSIFHDGQDNGVSVVPGMIMDYPDESRQHMIGAQVKDNEVCQNFRGFLYSFTAFNYALTDFNSYVSTTCNGCTSCMPGQNCFNNCGWNTYWDGEHCERCPIWCQDGCFSGGLC